MFDCRRVRRSSVPTLALEFLLESELERSGAYAVALGTLDGRPLAGVGDVAAWRIMAAAVKRLEGEPEHPLVVAFNNQSFRMSVIELTGGRKVLLTSVGASDLSAEAESGVARILS
jgi:hypothetical protein